MEKGYRFLRADNLTLLTTAMKQLLQSKTTHPPETSREPEQSQLLREELRKAQDPSGISTPSHRPKRAGSSRPSKPSRHRLPPWQRPSPGGAGPPPQAPLAVGPPARDPQLPRPRSAPRWALQRPARAPVQRAGRGARTMSAAGPP